MRGERLGPGLAIGGAAAAAVLMAFVAVHGGTAWRAWLAAALLCASVPTGALVLAMMTRLIPGSWREGLAEPLALAPGLLPLAALAMAPVLLAPGQLYAWTDDPGPTVFRQLYLSPGFFALRGALWFALLIVLALRLRPGREATAASTVGLLVVVPGSLVIATDWLVSLDPGFVSSGFGLYLPSLQITLALALAIASSVGAATPQRTRDVLGGVLFVVLALWGYLGFMQYFIIWSGDLPPGVSWYLRRGGGGWAVLVWSAIALKAAPGAVLVVGQVRRDPRALVAIALCVVAGSVLEAAWLVLPAPGAPAGGPEAAVFALGVAALANCGLGLCLIARARRRAA
jgi:hypothetical protein